MLYPTLNQPLMFLILICVGLLSGLIFDFFNILIALLGKDKSVKIFFNFLSVIFSFVILFISNLYFNFGQFRMYVLFVFIVAFYVQRVFSKILWTKVIKKCYNQNRGKRKCRIGWIKRKSER